MLKHGAKIWKDAASILIGIEKHDLPCLHVLAGGFNPRRNRRHPDFSKPGHRPMLKHGAKLWKDAASILIGIEKHGLSCFHVLAGGLNFPIAPC